MLRTLRLGARAVPQSRWWLWDRQAEKAEDWTRRVPADSARTKFAFFGRGRQHPGPVTRAEDPFGGPLSRFPERTSSRLFLLYLRQARRGVKDYCVLAPARPALLPPARGFPCSREREWVKTRTVQGTDCPSWPKGISPLLGDSRVLQPADLGPRRPSPLMCAVGLGVPAEPASALPAAATPEGHADALEKRDGSAPPVAPSACSVAIWAPWRLHIR